MSVILKPQNFHGWETLVNSQACYAPYFSAMLKRRVKKKFATNIVVTGEPGTGKSYQAIDIARILEGVTKSGKERFSVDQVVFTYKDYMQLVIKLKMGKSIVFDEPSYAMGKRDWYKDLNKALVQTIESQRFKVHPLLIPIINQALLDKTIRSYLIQFQIHVRDRGDAIVYRIYPSQHTEKIYRYHLCRLEYNMLDSDRCKRDSCLDCPKLLKGCNIFRAQYERKKAEIQDVRYVQAYDKASIKESTLLTDEQLKNMVYPLREEYTNSEGKIDVDLMRIVLQRKKGVRMGHNKAYRVAKLLRYDHKDDFI